MAPDPLIGRKVLGNYRVERPLGAGGMGAVYLLSHETLPDTRAALKVLLPGTGDAARERFKQEALAAAAVGSHRVVRPLDVGEFEDGTPYIVMEFAPGRSLEDELAERGPMSVPVAVRIALRVADTIALAHQKAIIHRDLKPSNLMIQEEGEDITVKVLDFGVARVSGDIKVAHTAATLLVGTPGYMSPEAVAGQTVDGRTDVFALGVILFRMLTGKLPFPAENTQQAFFNALTNEAAPPVATLRPPGLDPIPQAVSSAVAAALEKDLQRRPTMAQLRALLDAALRTLPAPAAMRALPSLNAALPAGSSDAPTLSAAPAPKLITLPEAFKAAAAAPPVAAAAGGTRAQMSTRETRRALRWVLWSALGLTAAAGVAAAVAWLPSAGRGAQTENVANTPNRPEPTIARPPAPVPEPAVEVPGTVLSNVPSEDPNRASASTTPAAPTERESAQPGKSGKQGGKEGHPAGKSSKGAGGTGLKRWGR